MDYKTAGVDTHAGQRFVKLIGDSVKSTRQPHVMSGLGGFAAMSDVSFLKDYKQPVLLTTTDGVGTKLHLATLFDRHETVGIDLVAMCVNDLLVTGAKPLLFLDYMAVGRLNPEKMAIVVQGIAEGCRQARCSLVGGETAEHPDLLEDAEYDLAGFCVGVGEKASMIDGTRVQEGDVILALPSSGIHSNGVSLVRKLFLKNGTELPDSSADCEFLVNEILLKPTTIYEPYLRAVLDQGQQALATNNETWISGMIHVTGGGFFENIPRIVPEGLTAEIDPDKIPLPPVFTTIANRGVARREMYSVYNMGAGMIVFARPVAVGEIQKTLKGNGMDAAVCGLIKRGADKVRLLGLE
ncbi:MAG: phosphoribosylformylglycinamidine cyclo-ligase [Spirochaetia bacterium]|nr:phosphoribosylformylglycinamidine cyclo-ligase [Spirochaetia bacterium]